MLLATHLGSVEVARQPLGNNESFELELSGVWEPSNALKEVIRIEKPKIVFLMETKLDRDWMKKFMISVVLSKV